jgi:hypothetical protein
MRRVAGLADTYSEKSEIMKLAKSVSKCAASVAMAKLLDNQPPAKNAQIY